MRIVTAYPLMIPGRPTPMASELAAEWPAWAALFNQLDSLGRKYLAALARPLEDYREWMTLWAGLSNPWSAEAAVRDIADGYSPYITYPPILMGALYIKQVDNPSVRNVYVTKGTSKHRVLVFPNISFLVDYVLCLKYTQEQPWCTVHTVPGPHGDVTYLLFEKLYDSVQVEFAADQNHSADYTITIAKKDIRRDHLWNQLDEWGFKYELERNVSEHDMFYARRLNDIMRHIPNATSYGIRNGVLRDFGIITCPGSYRLPFTLPGELKDIFGDPTRTDIPAAAYPRVLQVAKYTKVDAETYITTTQRDPEIRYMIFKVKGDGHMVVTPAPDHVHTYASVGNQRDLTARASYLTLQANGKDPEGQYVWDPNAATIEVKSTGNVVDDESYFILEYRARVSRVMPDDQPVDKVYIRSTTFEDISIPFALEYAVVAAMGRTFAINDPEYRKAHFENFDGAADYTEAQKQHYLGLTHKAKLRPPAFQNRNEAFTDITQYGLNRLSHEQVAAKINDMTKVMWRSWQWGHAFWWEESVLQDPNAIIANYPPMERGLSYVPNIWDSGFRQ